MKNNIDLAFLNTNMLPWDVVNFCVFSELEHLFIFNLLTVRADAIGVMALTMNSQFSTAAFTELSNPNSLVQTRFCLPQP